MSKAFTRESEEDGASELPDRIISTAPNLVTAAGLAAIEAKVEHWSREHAAAAGVADPDALVRISREWRYWTARRQTAQPMPEPSEATQVAFGSRVTIERGDGRRSTWRIVGEDEADPANGLLSHAAPVARALMGREVGDTVQAGPCEAEIVEIEL